MASSGDGELLLVALAAEVAGPVFKRRPGGHHRRNGGSDVLVRWTCPVASFWFSRLVSNGEGTWDRGLYAL